MRQAAQIIDIERRSKAGVLSPLRVKAEVLYSLGISVEPWLRGEIPEGEFTNARGYLIEDHSALRAIEFHDPRSDTHCVLFDPAVELSTYLDDAPNVKCFKLCEPLNTIDSARLAEIFRLIRQGRSHELHANSEVWERRR